MQHYRLSMQITMGITPSVIEVPQGEKVYQKERDDSASNMEETRCGPQDRIPSATSQTANWESYRNPANGMGDFTGIINLLSSYIKKHMSLIVNVKQRPDSLMITFTLGLMGIFEN